MITRKGDLGAAVGMVIVCMAFVVMGWIPEWALG